MQYRHIQPAIFVSRPNRFIAEVTIDGQLTRAHVKNTGRCAELLLPGAQVFLEQAENPHRVTAYDLISVYKRERLINMDSQAPNRVFFEYLQSGRFLPNLTGIRAEARLGHARLDFTALREGRPVWIEVKGVTLEQEGVARFPDAPTERGIKHLHTLMDAVASGCEAYVVFVIQMRGIDYFAPNRHTHAAFADALQAAKDAGVGVVALDCQVTETSLRIRQAVPVRLDG